MSMEDEIKSKSPGLLRRALASFMTIPDLGYEPRLYFGMRGLRFCDATQRFLVVGSPGSGKTVLLDLLMRTTLPYIVRPGHNHRALIYDAKRDMLPILADIGFKTEHTKKEPAQVRTLNPFDKRSFAWDISKDICSPGAALQTAKILISPEENAAQPFFTDSARELLYAVLLSFLTDPPKGGWSLRTVLLVLRDRQRLRRVIARSPHTKAYEVFFGSKKELASIMSTLATKLLPFEVVAALWEKAMDEGRSLSLSEWVQGNFVLVLGNHPANRAALQAINAAIFQRISDLLLTQNEVKSHTVEGRKTWLFLDEVVDLGALEGLSKLINQGRSKGVCTVLGFQDIEGMRAVYGDHEAHEIVGNLDNKTFLRTESQPTAKWVEEHFGEDLNFEYTQSFSESQDHEGKVTHSESLDESIQQRANVLASEVMAFPKSGPAYSNVIAGVHDIGLIGPYFRSIHWYEVEQMRGLHGIKNLALFVGRLKHEPDAISQFLLSHFSKLTRQTLGAYDGLGSDPEPLQSHLVGDLKRIVETQTIYSPERFKDVRLSAKCKKLASESLQNSKLADLNKLLLSEAYQFELGAPPAAKEVPGEIPRPISDQYMRPWTAQDDASLGPPPPYEPPPDDAPPGEDSKPTPPPDDGGQPKENSVDAKQQRERRYPQVERERERERGLGR